MEKGSKTAFCKSLEWQIKIEWLDKTGFYKLKDGRVVRIEPETHGTSGEYPGFLVTILNPKEGKVDSKFFLFDDYLDPTSKGRKDGRANDDSTSSPYPVGKNTCYHVIAHTGWKWYIAEPKTTRPFCEAVEQYVEIFAR